MKDWKDEEFIALIERKLFSGAKLDEHEIECVCTALRKADGITQEPYYEVVYHDKYGRKERRIMNPVSHDEYDRGEFIVCQDKFEVLFQRLENRGTL